jgi:hypothetical protein
VLFYEHQGKQALPVASQAQQAQAAEQLTPAVANAMPETVARAGAKREVPRTPSKARTAETAETVDALGRYSQNEPTESKKAKAGALVGGLLATSRHRPEQGRLPVADAFTSSIVQSQAKTAFDSKQDTLSKAPTPLEVQSRAAAASAAPQVAPRANATAELSDRKIADNAARGDISPSAGAALQSQPAFARTHTMKAVATPSIAGSLATNGVHGFVPIAHWSISANSKLQRQSSNGALTTVEPAPGVTVRAVAAQGIEVWAGGSQPDLSTTQWQQRPVLFHSSDAGETWAKIDGPWQGAIQSLVLADVNSVTVVTNDGRWTTTDAGQSWNRK